MTNKDIMIQELGARIGNLEVEKAQLVSQIVEYRNQLEAQKEQESEPEKPSE